MSALATVAPGGSLARLQSWAEVRLLAVLVEAEREGRAVTLRQAVRATALPPDLALLTLGRLERHGAIRTVLDELGERCYRLADRSLLVQEPEPAGDVGAATEDGEAAPAPAPPSEPAAKEDPRRVASELRRAFRSAFGVEPNLPWLMRQRKRAAALGLDLGQVMVEAARYRPTGNPQAYLEGILKHRTARAS